MRINFRPIVMLSLKLALLVSFSAANAQVKLFSIFKSGVVLQQGVKVPVWGTATAGDVVNVKINTTTVTSTADASGNWTAELPVMTAGGPYKMSVNSNTTDSLKLTDVYVGDVWLAAGQSNMEFKLNEDVNGTATIAAANDQTIREFFIPKGLSKELSNELPTGTTWSAATSANAGGFSAVAYYFAKKLKQSINTPIGIVKAAYGGARIEAFMSEAMLGFDEDFTVLQPTSYYAERQPTMIYNKMINPLLRFPIKGILWYQGESNADGLEDSKAYADLFQKMINSWRANLSLGDIPFVFVQLPNQGSTYGESTPQLWDAWPQVRKGQEKALALNNTGQVVTIDVGDVGIHPKNKKPVGERAALVARKLAYGQNVSCYGPTYASYTKLTGGKIQITFNNVSTGLIGKGTDTVRWFSIAGTDGILKQAKAKITGINTVEVWNTSIANPDVIRYAWEYNPVGVNLYNSDSLPAAPFYLNLNAKPFKLNSFTASVDTIFRGTSVNLNWSVNGASNVTLNGVNVDSVALSRVYPKVTTIYTLVAVSKADASVKDSIIRKVVVKNPLPTISVSSNGGTTVSPNTLITLVADAKAPGAGIINNVRFFLNGNLLVKDSIAPYQIDWTPTTAGSYNITAQVVDSAGLSATSAVYNILVTAIKVVKYEAELANFTGDTEVFATSIASNGKLLRVQDSWVLNFDRVMSPDARKYQMTVGYLLNYGGPKTQTLFVNGVSQTVVFPDTAKNAVQKLLIDVNLKAGANEIRFEPSWKWMSFDYISISIDSNALIPPAVWITSDKSNTIAPKTAVTLSAEVETPSSPAFKVEFVVNGTILNTDIIAPYQYVWTPTLAGNYAVYSKLTDENGNVAYSDTLNYKVTSLTIVTLEAEEAVLSGTTSVIQSAGASKGKALSVTDPWVVKFNNVNVPSAGTYELTIGYQLNFDLPNKVQYMYVNGVVQNVEFTATSKTDWLVKVVNVNLVAGVNEIRFEKFWGWMTFDYISYGYAGTVGINDKTYENNGLVLNQNYPNPCADFLNVSYDLPTAGDVQVDIVNITGTVVASQKVGSQAQGNHEVTLQTENLKSGIYLLRLSHNGNVVSRTMSVNK